MKWVYGTACLLLSAGLLSGAPPGQPASDSTGQHFRFVVFGDNRGDDTGEQPAAFGEVIRSIDRVDPVLVLDTGDMIYGHSSDENRVREEWQAYRQAIRSLRAHILHIPGNHDLWNKASARIYRELWGEPYHATDYGNSRFIGLDSESDKGRIDDRQFQWLQRELETCTQSNVFVFLHRPLFPVDGGIGSSLDLYPRERDRLHNLFAQHRRIVRAVFAGHEHLYNFQSRDGVRYYTTGGGGAPLYTAPELGGYHHFLEVQVDGDQAEIRLKKVSAPSAPRLAPVTIAPGQRLESWESGLLWYAWDRTASVELTSGPTPQDSRALRLNFDLAQYAWPVLALSLANSWDLSDCTALSLKVYLPTSLTDRFTLTPAIQGLNKREAVPVELKPGWNTVTTTLLPGWLPEKDRRHVEGLEWSLSANGKASDRGYVLFDDLRITRRNHDQTETTDLLENWNRPMLWRCFDETVTAEIGSSGGGSRPGLQLHLDLSSCNRPIVFAQLNPAWNLSKVQALVLQVNRSGGLPRDLGVRLALRSENQEYDGPIQLLPRDPTELRFDLGPNWLPEQARTAVELVGFRFVSASAFGRGQVGFEKLSAAEGP